MAGGYLSIVLHAHLPYVRSSGRRPDSSEFWFHERARECYLPLIRILDGLQRDGVRTRITLSLSPTLIGILRSPLIQERLAEHVDRMVELSARELNRTALMPELRSLAGTYHLRLLQVHNALVQRCGGNLLRAFAEMESRGQVELITCPASHAFLPGLAAMQPQAARCQVRLGLDAFERAFGHPPAGFWLPECAYSPELDDILGREQVGYIIVDGRALEHASPPAFHGIHAPVYCPSGVAAFGRDRTGGWLMGCDTFGHPTDAAYRDNGTDIADELQSDYLRPFMPDAGVRVGTGIRYQRIGGENGESRSYVRTAALDRAAQHAEQWMRERMGRAESAAGTMDRPPMFVSAYDMHVFGYRWFEGIEFLDYLLRKTHFDQQVLETITPAEYLGRHQCNQMTVPAASSWGKRGYFEEWVDQDTAWVYHHLSRAARVMQHLTEVVTADHAGGNGKGRSGDPGGNGDDLSSRALRAAGRQLVLAQSGDWVTMMRSPEQKSYGRERLEQHLSNFARVAWQIGAKRINAVEIEALERDWPIFEDIRTDAYRNR